MNRKLLFTITSILFFTACDNHDEAHKSGRALVFMGSFSGEPIRIMLHQVSDSNIEGTSNHKGISSKMEGLKSPSAKGYAYTMTEKGSSEFEGIFRFEYDTFKKIITGLWTPIDTNKKFVVQYTLSKVDCSHHK